MFRGVVWVGMQLWSWCEVVEGLSDCGWLGRGLVSWVVHWEVVEEVRWVWKAEAQEGYDAVSPFSHGEVQKMHIFLLDVLTRGGVQ
jgi:hypothetical protein